MQGRFREKAVDVIEAEEIKLDRWTVVFRPLSEETTEGIDGKALVSTTQATEDNAQVRILSPNHKQGPDLIKLFWRSITLLQNF